MYKKNEFIIYKREVCKIKEIIPNFRNNQDYYLLAPISDESLSIKVPTNIKDIRNLISKEEVLKIIETIPTIKAIESNTKTLEGIYKELINEGSHESLIKIIKTTYLRNKERTDNNKKTTDKDNYYFNLAEKYLYQEFQVVLNLTYEETKEFVTRKVEEILSK